MGVTHGLPLSPTLYLLYAFALLANSYMSFRYCQIAACALRVHQLSPSAGRHHHTALDTASHLGIVSYRWLQWRHPVKRAKTCGDITSTLAVARPTSPTYSSAIRLADYAENDSWLYCVVRTGAQDIVGQKPHGLGERCAAVAAQCSPQVVPFITDALRTIARTRCSITPACSRLTSLPIAQSVPAARSHRAHYLLRHWHGDSLHEILSAFPCIRDVEIIDPTSASPSWRAY